MSGGGDDNGLDNPIVRLAFLGRSKSSGSLLSYEIFAFVGVAKAMDASNCGMSGGGGGKGFCGWARAGDGFDSSCSEHDCFLGGGKKGMKIFGGGVLKEESLELKYSSVFLPLLAALLLVLGLGFNLNLGVLILDRSCWCLGLLCL